MTLHFEPSEIEFRADGDRLVQVLVNLVSNAIKFSPPKGTIRMWAVHNEKEVHIYVSDEGRGVPEELRTAIFERFKQVDQSDSHKGTGLGLAICKMIVDSHGGEIGVRVPELGKGSEFWFTVPQEAVVPVPDSQPA